MYSIGQLRNDLVFIYQLGLFKFKSLFILYGYALIDTENNRI